LVNIFKICIEIGAELYLMYMQLTSLEVGL
jgi:hypothetical protein